MVNNKMAVQQRELDAIRFSLEWFLPYFEDETITDIFVDHGKVSVKSFGKEREDTPLELTVEEVNKIIIQVAKYLGKNIDWSKYPVLEGNLPCFDARITGLMSWTKDPVIIIRKRPQFLYLIDDYVANKQLSETYANSIKKAIRDKKNILVSGGPGSGKTTFTNAIIYQMAEYSPNDSYFVVEDTSELQCTAKYAELLTVPMENISKAIELALRSSPDRIIFGEVRNGKVLKSLLEGWNTGCPGGVATIHANDAYSTITRMENLLKEEGCKDIKNWTNVVDLIIHLKKDGERGIVIDEILEKGGKN